MPVEIRELIIKATVALDWDNKTATEANDNIVCLRLPDEKHIRKYVNAYFKRQKEKTISFDTGQLTAFLLEWQACFLK